MGLEDGDAMDQIMAIRESHDQGLPDLLDRNLHCAKDFVTKLLCTTVRRRLGSNGDGKEVRSHNWFRQGRFDFGALEARALPPPFQPDTKVFEQKFDNKLTSVIDLPTDTNNSLYMTCR